MSGTSRAPELLRPADGVDGDSRMAAFVRWLAADGRAELDGYDDLWRWSTESLEDFWQAIWDHFGVRSTAPYDCVLRERVMPGAAWFPGARLNYAEHVFAAAPGPDRDAVIGWSQTRGEVRLTHAELADAVARARTGLRRLGVGRGDRVVAYLPNIPETVVAYLATISLGAVWASCAPEFGSRSVVERFAQVEPTVLLTVTGYAYGDKPISREQQVEEVRAALPTLRAVVHVPYLGDAPPDAVSWEELLAEPGPLEFEQVSFDHPMCVLFSSGTTGRPKAIVHCHGGLLLEHLKNDALSFDLGEGDTFMWFSTTAWMMWNLLVSGLLVGATIVTIDGNPIWPDLAAHWRLAEDVGATVLGASPGLIMASRAEGLDLRAQVGLSRVREVAAAGSPLAAEGYHWIAEQLGPGVLLNVGSGGTDICTGMVQGSPLQPVWAGEISGPCLAVAAAAWDDHGRPVVGERGELVITEPMPSMPVGFWGDEDGSRYRESYFEHYPGVWRHGDWIRFGEAGSCVVMGRSDATLNRGGVRLGTAEFYQVLVDLTEVADSLVVHLEDPEGGLGELILFVALREGVAADAGLERRIGRALRDALSPRHVPDRVVVVPGIPVNRTGKKLEVPVKRILRGEEPSAVLSLDVLADPAVLEPYVEYARQYGGRP
ncbi:acetoacetate--CoA ligase [Nocardioides hungaricus]